MVSVIVLPALQALNQRSRAPLNKVRYGESAPLNKIKLAKKVKVIVIVAPPVETQRAASPGRRKQIFNEIRYQ